MKPPKPKAVKVRLISPETDEEMYRLLQDLVAAHHEELAKAKIALAWHLGWKADPDSKLRLGKARKVGDPERQLMEADLVVLLNRDIWMLEGFGMAARRALLDHELSHFAPALDQDGAQKRDELGRPVWRIRKHDVEEFVDIVKRHGLWKSDLVQLARATAEKADAPLLDQPKPTPKRRAVRRRRQTVKART